MTSEQFAYDGQMKVMSYIFFMPKKSLLSHLNQWKFPMNKSAKFWCSRVSNKQIFTYIFSFVKYYKFLRLFIFIWNQLSNTSFWYKDWWPALDNDHQRFLISYQQILMFLARLVSQTWKKKSKQRLIRNLNNVNYMTYLPRF